MMTGSGIVLECSDGAVQFSAMIRWYGVSFKWMKWGDDGWRCVSRYYNLLGLKSS